MANINKIRLSGQTYDIQDQNASKTVELTQAQYDALTVKDPNTFYVITDAQGADLSNYYTKSETSGATEISTALNTKQDTLVSGTNIKTINNESLLGSGNIDIQGGGGKAISAGTNISVTTGETADTIDCTLPITVNKSSTTSLKLSDNSAYINFANYSVTEGYKGGIDDSSHYSHKEGYYSKIENYCQGSHVEGWYCEIKFNSRYSHAEGYYTRTTNESEHSSGRYNVSNKANYTFGDSGNTLFSVGNGTADNARHNAFEIRQNGDIYLTKDGQDVKLQDQLGGSSITVDSALSSTSENPVQNKVIYNKIDEVEQVTAAALNELNDKIGNINTILESI